MHRRESIACLFQSIARESLNSMGFELNEHCIVMETPVTLQASHEIQVCSALQINKLRLCVLT